jgi:hypothetical protein
VTGRVASELLRALAKIQQPLANAGFLVTSHTIIDEGAWGRLDARVEGPQADGKLQIHLNKKGVISTVPQGTAAVAIGDALGIRTQARGRAEQLAPAMDRPSSTPAAVPRATSARAAGTPGEFVVDCSKFGKHLIGPTEWRGMLCVGGTQWGEVFHSARFVRGHNNLGEFLAIIDACRLVESGQVQCASIWSDSKTAISWFQKGKIRSSIDIDAECDADFAQRVKEAIAWLDSPSRARFSEMISRWDVSTRGENPADFGRK